MKPPKFIDNKNNKMIDEIKLKSEFIEARECYKSLIEKKKVKGDSLFDLSQFPKDIQNNR